MDIKTAIGKQVVIVEVDEGDLFLGLRTEDGHLEVIMNNEQALELSGYINRHFYIPGK